MYITCYVEANVKTLIVSSCPALFCPMARIRSS